MKTLNNFKRAFCQSFILLVLLWYSFSPILLPREKKITGFLETNVA